MYRGNVELLTTGLFLVSELACRYIDERSLFGEKEKIQEEKLAVEFILKN